MVWKFRSVVIRSLLRKFCLLIRCQERDQQGWPKLICWPIVIVKVDFPLIVIDIRNIHVTSILSWNYAFLQILTLQMIQESTQIIFVYTYEELLLTLLKYWKKQIILLENIEQVGLSCAKLSKDWFTWADSVLLYTYLFVYWLILFSNCCYLWME